MDWLMLVPYRLQSSFYVKGVQVCKNSLAVNESRCSRIVGYMLLKKQRSAYFIYTRGNVIRIQGLRIRESVYS